MDTGQSGYSESIEGKHEGGSGSVEDVCGQAQDRALIRGGRFNVPATTTIQTIFIKAERGGEAQTSLLWTLQDNPEGGTGCVQAGAT
jgi:hypothetical protein